MKGKTVVRFWINEKVLYVQNDATDTVKTIKDQKKIALFLNEHFLTADKVNGTMYGFDVMELFEDRVGLPGVVCRGER